MFELRIICVSLCVCDSLFPCRYGMRFIAKTLKDTLNERFPDATEDELLKVCYITAVRNHSSVIPVQHLADVIVRF